MKKLGLSSTKSSSSARVTFPSISSIFSIIFLVAIINNCTASVQSFTPNSILKSNTEPLPFPKHNEIDRISNNIHNNNHNNVNANLNTQQNGGGVYKKLKTEWDIKPSQVIYEFSTPFNHNQVHQPNSQMQTTATTNSELRQAPGQGQGANIPAPASPYNQNQLQQIPPQSSQHHNHHNHQTHPKRQSQFQGNGIYPGLNPSMRPPPPSPMQQQQPRNQAQVAIAPAAAPSYLPPRKQYSEQNTYESQGRLPVFSKPMPPLELYMRPPPTIASATSNNVFQQQQNQGQGYSLNSFGQQQFQPQYQQQQQALHNFQGQLQLQQVQQQTRPQFQQQQTYQNQIQPTKPQEPWTAIQKPSLTTAPPNQPSSYSSSSSSSVSTSSTTSAENSQQMSMSYQSNQIDTEPEREITFLIHKPGDETIIQNTLLEDAKRIGQNVEFVKGPNLKLTQQQKLYLPPKPKTIVYIMLTEPQVETNVEVMGQNGSEEEKMPEPEVYVVYQKSNQQRKTLHHGHHDHEHGSDSGEEEHSSGGPGGYPYAGNGLEQPVMPTTSYIHLRINHTSPSGLTGSGNQAATTGTGPSEYTIPILSNNNNPDYFQTSSSFISPQQVNIFGKSVKKVYGHNLQKLNSIITSVNSNSASIPSNITSRHVQETDNTSSNESHPNIVDVVSPTTSSHKLIDRNRNRSFSKSSKIQSPTLTANSATFRSRSTEELPLPTSTSTVTATSTSKRRFHQLVPLCRTSSQLTDY